MYSFRILQRAEERAAFKYHFEEQVAKRSKGASALTVPENYLQHARLTGCFNRKGEMVAGYAINHLAPFRCLDAIPEPVRMQWLSTTPAENQCELTLIWRTPRIGHLAFALFVWTKIVLDCIAAGKSYILGVGYRNPVNQYYGASNPIMVFDGHSTQLETHIFVYAYTRFSIGATYFVNFYRDLIVKPISNLFKSKKATPPL